MRLVYYRGRTANFGDDFNAELWPALAPELFETDDGAAFVGIGTIIGMACDTNLRLNVFSSGIGNNDPCGWRRRETRYWCVRGPISRKILALDAETAISDGAILAPLAPGFPHRAADPQDVIVIPHWETLDHPGWPEVAKLTGYEIVDPRRPSAVVLERIAGAKLVLTESLHGAIFADLLGVPWHAFATSRNFGVTKWIDWRASLGSPFVVTMVAAPDPSAVLAFGRRPEPLGKPCAFGVEDAGRELHARLSPTASPSGQGVRQQLKAMLGRSPLAGMLLGYTPERTAEHLEALARRDPIQTPARIIEPLQDRMMARLQSLRAEHRRCP